MLRLNPLTLAVASTALASFTVLVVHAQTRGDARAGAIQTAHGGLGAHSAVAARGNQGAFAGQRALVADGQGNVDAAGASGFTTAAGGQGRRTARFDRSADGSVAASADASATGRNGSTAERSGSFSRSGAGSASGERSTALTNANTGVTFDGSTSYSQGSGLSRSASCKDAAGTTVACGAR